MTQLKFDEQIRFLVESYYDVQKLRVEAFNRIVAWCGSHSSDETHKVCASHRQRETHAGNASHMNNETQATDASQSMLETHLACASQVLFETQTDNASHSGTETHTLRAKVKPSALATQITTRKTETPKSIEELVWYHNSLHETEKQIAKRINAWSKHHKIRLNYLSKIQGIGPIFSSALIAWLTPISRFDNISKLWKYCGQAPNCKRKRGEKIHYNPHLKTLMWKIAGSFEKQNPTKSVYRKLYTEKKNYLLQRPDLAEAIQKKEKGSKLHVRLLAMRFIAKRFLADLWVNWRKMEGLTVTEPYAIAILGHDSQPTTQGDAQ